MSLNLVDAGRDLANDFNVIIEIPMHADPIKYEVDKQTGALFVDRFVSTSMHYPCNYGYIPQTVSGDGDPVDVLVITPFALMPGVVVRCRPIGLLKMTDEAGPDTKLLSVPIDKLTPLYRHVETARDLPELTLSQITHFFAHYKDLEPGKWVKIEGWGSPEEARREVLAGVAAAAKAEKKAAVARRRKSDKG
jgi:inorganic pyrophosphatase